jgi:deazaflavin-dependent oxidoreductase (nitroreductase family)
MEWQKLHILQGSRIDLIVLRSCVPVDSGNAGTRTYGGLARGRPFEGVPTILLHHRGAKSGVERVSPLVYQQVGNAYAVFATAGGAPVHPAWYRNLMANPETQVESGTATFDVTARELEGNERKANECAPARVCVWLGRAVAGGSNLRGGRCGAATVSSVSPALDDNFSSQSGGLGGHLHLRPRSVRANGFAGRLALLLTSSRQP